MKDFHSPKPEHGRKSDTSPLDDVHTAPYAAYAERILAEGALGGEQKDSPLSVVLQKGEENESGSEAAAQAELDRFKSEIEEIKKQFAGNSQKTIEISHDDFEVIYDPETSGYCVAPNNIGFGVRITITNYTGEFKGLTPLHIPTSLRLAVLNIYNYPLASIPDRVGSYEVSGMAMNEGNILMPKMSRSVHVINTFVKTLPQLPEMPESLNSLELVGNPLLNKLPELPENLFGLYTANNGSARRYSVDMLPVSLEILKVGEKESYSWSEKRVMKKRGINFEVEKA